MTRLVHHDAARMNTLSQDDTGHQHAGPSDPLATKLHARLAMTVRARPNRVYPPEARGVFAGFVAGACLLAAQTLAATLAHRTAILPLRHAASILIEEEAYTAWAWSVSATGAAVHACASITFGLLFALVATDDHRPARRNRATHIALGSVAGALIWLLNMRLIAPFFYPWIARESLSLQLVLHVFGFGIPLGATFAALSGPRPSVDEPADLGDTDTGPCSKCENVRV